MTSTLDALRHLSFLVFSLAASVGIMMALMRLSDALFSGSAMDLDAVPLMAIAMACGVGAWRLRRL